jgi:WXG100 family type VII secretion target
MSQAAPEFGQGEGTLTRAATLVADTKRDLDGYAQQLDGHLGALRGRWVGQGGAAFFALHQAWTERQATIVRALDAFEASLVATEHDNVATDATESATYARTAGRLGAR